MISTALYNILDYPAGSIPVTKATADDVAKMEDYPTPDPWHKAVKRVRISREIMNYFVVVVGSNFNKRLSTCLLH